MFQPRKYLTPWRLVARPTNYPSLPRTVSHFHEDSTTYRWARLNLTYLLLAECCTRGVDGVYQFLSSRRDLLQIAFAQCRRVHQIRTNAKGERSGSDELGSVRGIHASRWNQ